MALEFDQKRGKIFYHNREVGEHTTKDGKNIVRINLEYETASDEWVSPISWLAYGLARLPENAPSKYDLELTSPEDSIEIEFDGPQYLIEKTVRCDGYAWRFHKNDADTWPSALHGHDYERHLKLDVITGEVFDATTKVLRKRLKKAHLIHIQEALRSSPDFKEKISALLPSGT